MGGKSGDVLLLIHGHFYQPPRENPWLGAVEEQESASPYRDWNERILAECYRPNTRSRVLDPFGRVRAIVNNLDRISFNFGPTLLSWLERADPDTYRRILEADRAGAESRSGHGNAIAQAYHHVILPLVPREDRLTLIRWGLADFERRFGRRSEGLWLPETAIHAETAVDVARAGVRFVILSPYQAWRTRPLGGGEWRDVSDGSIDPRRAYRLFPDPKDPSLSVDVFFYDRGLSAGISFEHYLHSADALAKRLAEAAGEPTGRDRLVVVATDGEVYGHHEPFGDMCLAALFDSAAGRLGLRATNPGEFLDRVPTEHEVALKPGPDGEGTAWSCHHGVGRWSRDCGCSIAHARGWNQAWRAPLRTALLGLRADLAGWYESEGSRLFDNPRRALDSYVDVLGAPTEESWRRFAEREASGSAGWSGEKSERAVLLLDMAHDSLRMFTSCGWFFDDLAGIESVQDLLFAAHAIDLARRLDPDRAESVEARFRKALRAARSNVAEEGDGRSIYDDRSALARVGPADRIAAWAAARLVGAPFPAALLDRRAAEPSEERRAEHASLETLTGVVVVRGPLGIAEERWRYLAARAGRGEMAIWVGGEEIALDEALRASDFGEIRRAMRRPPRLLEDLPRELRGIVARRLLEREMDAVSDRLEALEAGIVPIAELLSRTGLAAPRWFRRLLPAVLDRRIRRAGAALVSAVQRDESGESSFRELADVHALAARFRVDLAGVLDERPLADALLASFRRAVGGGEGEEAGAGRLLEALQGLHAAGFPLSELSILQEAIFERSRSRSPAGPRLRELAGWLALAPEVFARP